MRKNEEAWVKFPDPIYVETKQKPLMITHFDPENRRFVLHENDYVSRETLREDYFENLRVKDGFDETIRGEYTQGNYNPEIQDYGVLQMYIHELTIGHYLNQYFTDYQTWQAQMGKLADLSGSPIIAMMAGR